MDGQDPPDDVDVDPIPFCNECGDVLRVELWVFNPRDIVLLHVCSRHGLAAISRPFT